MRGDCRDVLPTIAEKSVNCCVTSPPYFGLRDYGVEGQIGLEQTPDEYVAELVAVFREVWRVLKDDGTLWLNLGDSYSHGGCGSRDATKWPKQSRNDHMAKHVKTHTGLKPKDLIGIPWKAAFALQAEGWYLRQDIIWSKPNPMPESVTDRCTKAHEYIFLLTKSARYHYDHEAIKEKLAPTSVSRLSQNIDAQQGSDRVPGKTNGTMKAVSAMQKKRGHSRPHDGFNDKWDSMSKAEQQSVGRNKRSVWTVATQPYKEAHFATFPPALIEPCILAGCPRGGTVLDPFGGAGTTGLVADRLQRNAVLVELNADYQNIAQQRLDDDCGPMFSKASTSN